MRAIARSISISYVTDAPNAGLPMHHEYYMQCTLTVHSHPSAHTYPISRARPTYTHETCDGALKTPVHALSGTPYCKTHKAEVCAQHARECCQTLLRVPESPPRTRKKHRDTQAARVFGESNQPLSSQLHEIVDLARSGRQRSAQAQHTVPNISV